jgi:putative SOS response-associated peptidase YedK
MKNNRCVIPCGGFYEFEKVDGKVLRKSECKAWLTGRLELETINDRKNVLLLKEAA